MKTKKVCPDTAAEVQELTDEIASLRRLVCGLDALLAYASIGELPSDWWLRTVAEARARLHVQPGSAEQSLSIQEQIERDRCAQGEA